MNVNGTPHEVLEKTKRWVAAFNGNVERHTSARKRIEVDLTLNRKSSAH